MGGPVPKQYLRLGDRTVLEWVLDSLFAHARINGVVLVLGEHDEMRADLGRRYRHHALHLATGGELRCHSVLNGLRELPDSAGEEDWVLVHDAARPCLRRSDLDRLMQQLSEDETGGLLGLPVRDTIKRADGAGLVSETVERFGLWHALTPQMFRVGILREALEQTVVQGVEVTDEAAAMEQAGLRPRLIEGHSDNLKITYPEDLALAEYYLRKQGRL
jgi:2-C-methyl-D-erythritol 4-phosphate cytidylyltransferase